MQITFDSLIYKLGFLTFSVIVGCIVVFLINYINKVLSKQTKIKCLCKHEYVPNSAFYYLDGVEYGFQCRKCGKTISVKAVTRDKFNWIEKE